MGNKSIRIRTTPGGNDKYLTLKLENDVDFFEVLSLKISQKDIYGSFNSDYGVIVGRVIANGGVGIPNAKVSVFIPLSDDDKSNSEITTVYPYTSPRDKDLNGVKYNLLPRVAVNNPFLVEGEYSPKVPVGTFPTKEEITTNPTFLSVYQKYYKFTTVTNQSGDYMIVGCPVGIQTVHMSCDITDIGKFSMSPSTMIQNLGYSPNLFTENGTKIKFSTDLETLPNVETQEIAVDVRPFWGDSSTFEIGITRQDFKLRAYLQGSFTIFGASFTDGEVSTWGQNDFASGDQDREMWRQNNDAGINISIGDKRIGKLSPVVAYYPNSVSDDQIASGSVNTTTQILVLDPSEYVFNNENGKFIFQLSCNRKKIITDEFGSEVVVSNDDQTGIFSEFNGMIFFSYDDTLSVPNFGQIAGGNFDNHTFFSQRWKFKIPQTAPPDQCLNKGDNETFNENWRKQSKSFVNGKIYSVAKFHWLSYADSPPDTDFPSYNDPSLDPFWNTGIISTAPDALDTNPLYQFPTNSGTVFGGEWMNFLLYFPQFTYYIRNQELERHSNNNPTYNNSTRYYFNDNSQKLVGGLLNTKNYLRNDFHQTTFIEIPREDVLNILNHTLDGSCTLGFKNTDSPFDLNPLIGDYKGNDSTKFFYKGLGAAADIFLFLREKNII
jgi:hypothetical protein